MRIPHRRRAQLLQSVSCSLQPAALGSTSQSPAWWCCAVPDLLSETDIDHTLASDHRELLRSLLHYKYKDMRNDGSVYRV